MHNIRWRIGSIAYRIHIRRILSYVLCLGLVAGTIFFLSPIRGGVHATEEGAGSQAAEAQDSSETGISGNITDTSAEGDRISPDSDITEEADKEKAEEENEETDTEADGENTDEKDIEDAENEYGSEQPEGAHPEAGDEYNMVEPITEYQKEDKPQDTVSVALPTEFSIPMFRLGDEYLIKGEGIPIENSNDFALSVAIKKVTVSVKRYGTENVKSAMLSVDEEETFGVLNEAKRCSLRLYVQHADGSEQIFDAPEGETSDLTSFMVDVNQKTMLHFEGEATDYAPIMTEWLKPYALKYSFATLKTNCISIPDEAKP